MRLTGDDVHSFRVSSCKDSELKVWTVALPFQKKRIQEHMLVSRLSRKPGVMLNTMCAHEHRHLRLPGSTGPRSPFGCVVVQCSNRCWRCSGCLMARQTRPAVSRDCARVVGTAAPLLLLRHWAAGGRGAIHPWGMGLPSNGFKVPGVGLGTARASSVTRGAQAAAARWRRVLQGCPWVIRGGAARGGGAALTCCSWWRARHIPCVSFRKCRAICAGVALLLSSQPQPPRFFVVLQAGAAHTLHCVALPHCLGMPCPPPLSPLLPCVV